MPSSHKVTEAFSLKQETINHCKNLEAHQIDRTQAKILA